MNHHHPPPRHTYPAYLELIHCLWQSKWGEGHRRLQQRLRFNRRSTVRANYHLVLACKWVRYAVDVALSRSVTHRRESPWRSEESSRRNVFHRLLQRKDHTQLFYCCPMTSFSKLGVRGRPSDLFLALHERPHVPKAHSGWNGRRIKRKSIPEHMRQSHA